MSSGFITLRPPRLFETLRHYDARMFAGDLVAGITVGLVALPLAMAFAIASGAPPQSGIYTAIVAGLRGLRPGCSRVQIGGPTGAFVVVISGIIAHHGLDGLFMCTLLAGLLLILMGLTGMGGRSAISCRGRSWWGFTNGIALLIASTQLKDLLGLDIRTTVERVPATAARGGERHRNGCLPRRPRWGWVHSRSCSCSSAGSGPSRARSSCWFWARSRCACSGWTWTRSDRASAASHRACRSSTSPRSAPR
jgi:hypothetical protein